MKMVPTPTSVFAKPVAAVYDRRSVRGLVARTTATAFGIFTLCPLCLGGENQDGQLTLTVGQLIPNAAINA